jgi:hypothetical protein
MPGERLPMRKIIDVLRLHAEGLSKRKIAASLSIGATSAGECVRRATRAGLSWPLPENLEEDALERLLYPCLDVGGPLSRDRGCGAGTDGASLRRRSFPKPVPFKMRST